MTNKPFDPTKPVRTRDGRKARIICTDAKSDFPIIALVQEEDGCEHTTVFTAGGYFWATYVKNDKDLINIPEQTHRWFNVYESGTAGVHYTRSKADKSAATPGRIAVLHLIFEDRKLVSSEVEHV